MKTFETPKIEVVTFVAENIMVDSGTGNSPVEPSRGENQLPWI